MATTLKMTQGKPFRLLLRFSIPLMAGNILQQLYTVLDSIIVGRYIGMNALAALGSIDWLTWLMITLSQSLTQGFSVRTAQKFGECDYEGLQCYLSQSAILSCMIATFCLLFGQLLMPVFLAFLSIPNQLATLAETYIRILYAGFPLIILFNYCSAMLRAVGNSKTPLMAMTISSVCNIVLDLVAILVFDWGIAGAAIATVASHGISCCICIIAMQKIPVLRFHLSIKHIDYSKQKELLRIGLPASAKNLLVTVGGISVQRFINSLGVAYIAGFTATAKFGGILEIAAISYSFAITTYIGQNYGAGNISRVKEGVRDASYLAILTSIFLSSAIFLFGRSCIMLFISSEDPILALQTGNIAYTHLCVMAVTLSILYMLYVVLSVLQGLGNTTYAMYSGIVESAVRITAIIVIKATCFQAGIFLVESLAWLSTLLYLGYQYLRLIRKLNCNAP